VVFCCDDDAAVLGVCAHGLPYTIIGRGLHAAGRAAIPPRVPALSFAVVSSSERTREALASFCQKLETSTGLPIVPAVLESYSALLEGVAAGSVDVAWSPPLVAVALENRGIAGSLAVVKRSLRAGYHSALFVRAQSSLRKPEELSQVRAAWVSPESASGYVVPRWHLRSLGVALDQIFSKEAFYGSHEAVAAAVLGDEADVGATHVGLEPVSGKLATAPWLNVGAPASAVRVLLLIGPIPGDVIVSRNGVPSSTRRALLAALLAMREDPAGAAQTLFESSRFEPVPEGHFTMLRRLSRYDETRA
jgi:phosphate/phosphite/phosphonate ABC transporter binding protein